MGSHHQEEGEALPISTRGRRYVTGLRRPEDLRSRFWSALTWALAACGQGAGQSSLEATPIGQLAPVPPIPQ